MRSCIVLVHPSLVTIIIIAYANKAAFIPRDPKAFYGWHAYRAQIEMQLLLGRDMAAV